MKVAWVIYGSLDQPTGGYVYDRLVVELLRSRGVEIEIVSLAPGAEPRAVARLVSGSRPDVVVGDGLCIPELGAAFERIRDARRVLLVHHLASWELERSDVASIRACEARALASCDDIITTSAASASRLHGEHDARVVHVVVPGADRLPRSRARLADSGSAWLGVGTLTQRKRWPLVLEAFERAADPHATLRLVGDATRDPRCAANLEARIAASPYLRSRVARLGVVDDDTLSREYAAASALVLASSLEGYGMVLTEALHAGLPIIAARASVAAQEVGRGEALLFDDVVGLAETLCQFGRDAAMRARMREAVAARLPWLPTWAQTADRFCAVLRAPHERLADL